jgi:FkbH-like protein
MGQHLSELDSKLRSTAFSMSSYSKPGTSFKTFGISATFTAEPLLDTLAFWFDELSLRYRTEFAPYHQVFQQLLDPSSLLRANANGSNAVLVRIEDLSERADPDRADPSGAGLDRIEHNVRDLIASLEQAAANVAAPFLLCICPPSDSFLEDSQRASFAARMEDILYASADRLANVHAITMTELRKFYPVAAENDPHADRLGHVPYTPEFFTALGTLLARKLYAMSANLYKAIALDCDDTLWRGVCGEDGPEGVVVDPPRRALQEFMLAQLNAGMLLCLSSKNNAEDVDRTFGLHPEMPLRLEHFAARRIDWESKSANLERLAAELNLGLDGIILVDDNPEECAEVRARCPQVLVLPLPPGADRIPHFLEHVWAFDHPAITDEDRNRTALYSQERQRALHEKQATSLEEFVSSLQLEVRLAPMEPGELARVAQLTQRTNQMNTTTIRRSEAEIQALLACGKECLTAHVSDRFGHYGLTGVVIFDAAGGALTINAFLLSCRVLGRGVEHRVLAALGELAVSRGIDNINALFIPSGRNIPAEHFLESLVKESPGVTCELKSTGERLFRIPASSAKSIVYPAAGRPMKASRGESNRGVAEPSQSDVDLVRIATELGTVERIQKRVRAHRPPSDRSSGALVAPGTQVEREICNLWSELLGIAEVGIHDNFFDLGGHSLLAVQLIAQVRQKFGVELSLEIVYSGSLTPAELARAIELKEIESAEPERYASLLAEIEALSDEEVTILLAREQEGESSEGVG